MTAREKGLVECRKVKKVLEKIGFEVEGPGYKPLYIPKTGKMTVVHKDYFGRYDLLIMGKYHIFGVQVTADAGQRIEKARVISESPIGFVWYPAKERKRHFSILVVRRNQDPEEWSLDEFKSKMQSEI